MVQANELRIGNKLRFVVERRRNPIDRVVEVIKISRNDIVVKDMGFDVVFQYTDESVCPIPLTPEVIEKCGFKENVRDGMQCWEIEFGRKYFLQWHDDCSVLLTAYCAGVSVSDLIEPILCHHLHQLQNLYFSLTGEELQVNLK